MENKAEIIHSFLNLQVLLEMSPGQGIDKCILSAADLRGHAEAVHQWGPQELVTALIKDGFAAKLKNPNQGREESLSDLICFGSSEVIDLLISLSFRHHPRSKNERKFKFVSRTFHARFTDKTVYACKTDRHMN